MEPLSVQASVSIGEFDPQLPCSCEQNHDHKIFRLPSTRLKQIRSGLKGFFIWGKLRQRTKHTALLNPKATEIPEKHWGATEKHWGDTEKYWGCYWEVLRCYWEALSLLSNWGTFSEVIRIFKIWACPVNGPQTARLYSPPPFPEFLDSHLSHLYYIDNLLPVYICALMPLCNFCGFYVYWTGFVRDENNKTSISYTYTHPRAPWPTLLHRSGNLQQVL